MVYAICFTIFLKLTTLPQMPALLHGPRRTPLPSPAPHPPPQQSRDLEVIMKVERY